MIYSSILSKLLLVFVLNLLSVYTNVQSSDSFDFTRIIGEKADRDFSRFMVHLNTRLPARNFTDFYCGGSLISDQWVLTAAHCIYDKTKSPPGTVIVRYQLGDDLFGTKSFLETTNYFIHRDYNPLNLHNDIALIKLKNPVNLKNGRFEKIGLVKTNYLFDADTCISLGWGYKDKYGNFPNELQQATNQKIYNSNICEQYWSSPLSIFRPFNITTQICVGNPNQRVCGGDSGGPFICRLIIDSINNIRGDFVAVGVVSYGIVNYDIHGCELTPIPSVYSKVASFTPWIERTMKEN